MTDILTVAVIVGLMSVPYILFWQWLKLIRQYNNRPHHRTSRTLQYVSGILSSLYVVASIVVWPYFWLVFQPNVSPATSFSPDDQRLLGLLSYSVVGFLFVAPLVAAFLAAYRDSFKPRKQ